MVKYLYDKGQGTAKGAKEIGSVLYNRGMISAMLTVEAIKQAQSKYGKRVVTGEEVRWGAENLSLDAAKIKALGFGDNGSSRSRLRAATMAACTAAASTPGTASSGAHPPTGTRRTTRCCGPLVDSSAKAYAAREEDHARGLQQGRDGGK
jgi:branched-chain amino acid transport system substrate-binding protein